MKALQKLIKRLKRLNIDIKLIANVPWIYIAEINGRNVKEKYWSKHGFVIALTSIENNNEITYINIKKMFRLIRKYL
jgi:hypothetical protein